jgi:hypothetical protein
MASPACEIIYCSNSAILLLLIGANFYMHTTNSYKEEDMAEVYTTNERPRDTVVVERDNDSRPRSNSGLIIALVIIAVIIILFLIGNPFSGGGGGTTNTNVNLPNPTPTAPGTTE